MYLILFDTLNAVFLASARDDTIHVVMNDAQK